MLCKLVRFPKLTRVCAPFYISPAKYILAKCELQCTVLVPNCFNWDNWTHQGVRTMKPEIWGKDRPPINRSDPTHVPMSALRSLLSSTIKHFKNNSSLGPAYE